jgi:uncharacterized membrane protein
MADKPNLNPEPTPGPAELNKEQTLPKAAPVNASAETKGVWQGAFAAFGQAFEQIRKNPEPMLLFVAVYTALALISSFAGGYKTVFDQEYNSYEGLANLIFLLALPTYALAVANKKTISIAEFLKFDAARYFTLIGIFILSAIIFFFSFIPLIIFWIWTIAWFLLAGYASVDKSLGPIAALKESKRLAENNKAKVWGLFGVTILISFGAALLSFIPVVGAAATAFVSVVAAGAAAILYRWLQQNVPAES